MVDTSSSEEHDLSSAESENMSPSRREEASTPAAVSQRRTGAAAPTEQPVRPQATVQIPVQVHMTDDARSNNGQESQRDDTPIITGPHSIFSTNASLAENEFPSNAPPPESASAANFAPELLKSVESLVQETRKRIHFSNFEEVATPSRSARTPIFPSLKRFIAARFAKTEVIDMSIIESTNVLAGAAYDLFFPVNLAVTDSRGVALPGLPVEGIPDSQGYPLLYATSPKKVIRARSSGAMYPVNISRGLATKLSTYPDPGMLRAWSHMFQLDDDKSAQSILLGRVLGASAGDNHIALLLKAYFLYFDSAAGALKGVAMARNPQPSVGTVINVNTQPGWTAHVMDSGAEIVNVLGSTSDYQEFWAYCCFNQAPVFATKSSLESMVGAATQFSQYHLDQRFSMVCLCDVDAYSIERDPLFFGKPELVLNYIEMYVQKFGLQEQANEALQIAMLWPSLLVAGATISLPKPLHNADWLGAEVERTSTETGYGQLTACGPFMVLASTLAGAWAMQSQVYDFVTLLAAGRSTWALSTNTVASATAWLSANLAAPGVGWEFLFGSQFNTSASFLYLTGLSVDVVRWDKLLQPFMWKESHFPAHLRLLQPYWVESSVCCCLPWESAWLPEVSVSGSFARASPSTIMRLLRLGLLDTSAEGLERSATSHGIFPILERPGDEAIAVGPETTMMLRVLLQHGVRVQARFAISAVTPAVELFARGDPLDADAARESWSLGAAAKTKVSGKGSRRKVTVSDSA